MSNEIFLSGTGVESTEENLAEMLDHENTESLFFASAYVTYYGVDEISNVLDDLDIGHCAAVFGLDGYVTQPSAIELARELGWSLRLARGTHTFHPKMALTGGEPPDAFSDGPHAGYIGSANFTKGGFKNNIETGLITYQDEILSGFNKTANDIWELADPAEEIDIDEYSEKYAEISRKRSRDMEPPGVGETTESEGGSDPDNYEDEKPPKKPAYHPRHAIAAWAGLQSFTGDYTFQLEFPKTAGEIVKRLVGGIEGDVKVLCSDNVVREMTYRFYEDNGMFRLNIANEVPGIEKARNKRSGIALVEENESSDVPIKLDVIHDDEVQKEIVLRSKREGSWRETPTRLYGWF